MLGHPEILIVGVIVLVLFGASAIPRFARSVGRAKAEFEKGLTTGQKDASGQVASGQVASGQVAGGQMADGEGDGKAVGQQAEESGERTR